MSDPDFLSLNGIEIKADQDGLVDITLSAASGQAVKPQIAEFFRSLARDDRGQV